MAQPYIGEIIVFAGSFAPVGYAFCDGQLLAISNNPALYAVIGTTYGGDGQTTFALPDLRGRLALHEGTSPRSGTTYTLGEPTGSETVTLSTNQLPSHSHLPNCTANDGNAASPSGAIWAQVASPANVRGGQYSTSATNATMASGAIGNSTGGLGHPNIQPVLAVNFCIALQGIFPSQT